MTPYCEVLKVWVKIGSVTTPTTCSTTPLRP
jgi:hypothetical protein